MICGRGKSEGFLCRDKLKYRGVNDGSYINRNKLLKFQLFFYMQFIHIYSRICCMPKPVYLKAIIMELNTRAKNNLVQGPFL